MAAATPGNLAEPTPAHGKEPYYWRDWRENTRHRQCGDTGPMAGVRPRIGNIPGQIGQTTFGVIYNMDDEDNHDYLLKAAEVANFNGLPGDLTRLRLPEQTCAVFNTKSTSLEIWLPAKQFGVNS